VLFGIYLKDAPGSVVRNNTIQGKDLEMGVRGDGLRLWYSAGSLVEGNHVSDSRDMIVWFSPDTVVRGNTVERSRYGLHFMVNEDNLAEQNVLRDNSVGIYLMYGDRYTVRNNLLYNNRGQSGYGLALKDVNDVIVEGNYIVGNRVGVYNDNSPINPGAAARFAGNLLAYNDIGLDYLPLVQRNTFSNNVFQENGAQVSIAGQGELKGNAWSQDGRGNYWSDYAGFDANGDQVGDLPYRSISLYENLLETHPELRLFQLSPATDAIDLAARAFPIFQPRPNMADDSPLMSTPDLPPVPGLAEPPFAANLAVALGLLALAVLVLVAGAKVTWRGSRAEQRAARVS
jgi:nitrous oxidase accessory protein